MVVRIAVAMAAAAAAAATHLRKVATYSTRSVPRCKQSKYLDTIVLMLHLTSPSPDQIGH